MGIHSQVAGPAIHRQGVGLRARNFALRSSILFCVLLFNSLALAQIQQAWVNRYSQNAAATNQATAIALAPDGNIIIAGSSASTNGDLDYLVIKYAPNGQQLWLTRYDSPTNGADQLRGMALDPSGNVLLTGTSKTVKLNANGNFLWSAPYGGRAVAVDTNGNAYITGFSELDFATVKLDPNGTNLWLKTYTYLPTTPTNYPDISQVIAVGGSGIAVAGFETYNVSGSSSNRKIRTIVYDVDGNVIWSDGTPFDPFLSMVPVADAVSIAIGSHGSVLCMGNISYEYGYATRAFGQAGSIQWYWYLDADGMAAIASPGRAMVLDQSENAYMTGYRAFGSVACTVKLGTNGHKVWLATYQGPGGGGNQGNALTLDKAGASYVTGYSSGSGTSYDVFTLKYDGSGNQQWVQRYNGPSNGDDIGTGIVVDSQGAVYVCGYSATTNGGTEFATIKYAEL